MEEFQVSFRIHRWGMKEIEIPEDAIFIRLHYDSKTWEVTLYFIHSGKKSNHKVMIQWTTELPSAKKYLGEFKHIEGGQTRQWYVSLK